MLLMKRLHKASEVRPEDLFHREGIGSDHLYLDTPSPEGGGDLQADEARAQDDRRFGAVSALDDGAAVGERPQREHVRLVHTGYREPHGLGPGRDEEAVEREGPPLRVNDLLGIDVDARDRRAQMQIDAVVVVEFRPL